MESPFQSALYTNIIPTDAECDRIRDFLQASRKELVDLAEETSRLQSLLDAAVRRRDALEESIRAHAALASPFRRLPDDVLQGIFIAAIPSTRNPALFDVDEAPLLLCRICKPWRILALTTPHLWASMHIAVPPPSSLMLPRLVREVTAWLGRSGVVPLDISL
ncbi:hypothetical protein K438DRAFT_1647351, partial [Mycena galopus ATCC 62051]